MTPIKIIVIGLVVLFVGAYFSESCKPIKKEPVKVAQQSKTTSPTAVIVVTRSATCPLKKQPTTIDRKDIKTVPAQAKAPKNFKRHNRGSFPGNN